MCSLLATNEKPGLGNIYGRFSYTILVTNAAMQHQPEQSDERHRPQIRPHAR